MKKITVLFTVWSFNYGGAERFVLNIIKQLGVEQYNFVVFSDKRSDGPMSKEFSMCGAKILYAKCHRFKHPLRYTHQLRKLIRDEHVDIIHANDDLNMIFPLIAKPQNTPFVAHSHSTSFRFSSSKILNLLAKKWIMRRISRQSDCLLSCGELAGKALYGKSHFKVVRNGIRIKDFRFSESKRNMIRTRLGIGNKSLVLLAVGRLIEEKNHHFLIKLFNAYHSLNPNSYLIIIGDGDKRGELQSLVSDLSLSDSVNILKATDEVADYYSAADFFIMTSLHEGMPMVSIEAQANGLRCVFSDNITKEADHNGSTVFIPLTDGPDRWADIISHLKPTRSNSLCDRIIEYDIKYSAKEIADIYTHLIEERLHSEKTN